MDSILYNAHDVVLLITIYQCILFSILTFFVQRQSLQCNLFLVGFLLSSAAIPLDILLNHGEGIRDWIALEYSVWRNIFEFGYWLQGPFLLWYIRSLVYKKFTLGRWDLIYILPFLIYFPHQLINQYFIPVDFKAQMQGAHDLWGYPGNVFYIHIAREFLHVFFGVNCVIELRRYRAQLKKRNNELESPDFTWLKLMAYGFLTLWSWAFLNAILVVYTIEQIIIIDLGIMGLIANYITCGLMGTIMIVINRRSPVLIDMERVNTHLVPQHKVAINPDQVHALEELMKNEKPYLDPTLTLDSLAGSLSVTPRVLSHIINRHYGCNFFEFINTYRISATKEMLLSEHHRSSTVLDIMHNAGFNSKATFNNFFKKSEGMTPREYKKKYLEYPEIEKSDIAIAVGSK